LNGAEGITGEREGSNLRTWHAQLPCMDRKEEDQPGAEWRNLSGGEEKPGRPPIIGGQSPYPDNEKPERIERRKEMPLGGGGNERKKESTHWSRSEKLPVGGSLGDGEKHNYKRFERRGPVRKVLKAQSLGKIQTKKGKKKLSEGGTPEETYA